MAKAVETVDVQGTAIGVGTLVAVAFLAYGVLVSGSIVGVDTTTLASWAFAGTFAVVAALHAAYGRMDLAWGHGGAAGGWFFVLLGSSVFQIALGLFLLVVSGTYIALVTLRARREGGAERDPV